MKGLGKKYGSIIRRWLMAVVAVAVMPSCDSDFTYSSYPCYLVIDNSKHLDETLSTALTPQSPGVFCLITLNGACNTFIFENSHGQKSSKPFNAIDMRMSHQLGMNGGLIVGYGTFSEGRLSAFDRECPECFILQSDRLVARHLTLHEDGTASCPVCKNKYDMNNGGICLTSSKKGQKGMTTYRCSAAGPFGVLTIGN